MKVVVVVAEQVNNVAANKQVNEFANIVCADTCDKLKKFKSVAAHPVISAYREKMKALNINVKKFPQSNESLVQRVSKTGKAFQINPLVDFYNAVSIKHMVTAGGFDVHSLMQDNAGACNIELRLSTINDTFLVLGSKDTDGPIHVENDEVSYVQGTVVLTRHLAWRQSKQGLITPATTCPILMSEILIDQDEELHTKVIHDFQSGLKNYFGVDSKAFILDKNNTSVQFDVAPAKHVEAQSPSIEPKLTPSSTVAVLPPAPSTPDLIKVCIPAKLDQDQLISIIMEQIPITDKDNFVDCVSLNGILAHALFWKTPVSRVTGYQYLGQSFAHVQPQRSLTLHNHDCKDLENATFVMTYDSIPDDLPMSVKYAISTKPINNTAFALKHFTVLNGSFDRIFVYERTQISKE